MKNAARAFLVSLLALPACGSAADDDPAGARFVAVGAKGTIVVSSDGSSFEAKDSGTTEDLSSVAYGAGTFVAVGAKGTILTSTTGLEFAKQNSPTNVDLSHVIFTGDTFVAVGGDFSLGAVTVVSSDGITWAPIISPGTHMFHAVGHKDGTLIAAAYLKSDLQTPTLFTATPAQPWQEAIGPDFWDSVTNDDGIFTVGGTLVNHFAEGIGWTSAPLPAGAPAARAMAYGAGKFVVAGEKGSLFSSPDGKSFDDDSLDLEDRWFSGICFGKDSFLAVGDGGMTATSKDAVVWAKGSGGTTNTLFDVVYGQGQGTP